MRITFDSCLIKDRLCFGLRIVYAVLCISGVGACASVTSEELKASSSEKGSFSVNLPPKMAFQNIRDRVKECYIIGKQYTSLKVYEISYRQHYQIDLIDHNNFSTDVWLTVDIEGDDKGSLVSYARGGGIRGLFINNYSKTLIDYANDIGDHC